MNVIEEIAAERNRQKSVEGWTEEHDDSHTHGELADAAMTDLRERLVLTYDEWVNAINDLDDHWTPEEVPESCTIVSKKSALLAVRVLTAISKNVAVIVAPQQEQSMEGSRHD